MGRLDHWINTPLPSASPLEGRIIEAREKRESVNKEKSPDLPARAKAGADGRQVPRSPEWYSFAEENGRMERKLLL